MKKITIALLALISLFTISCEIGLGAAVDTEPPALDIVTPPVDAIIRDNFAIRGTWSDDGAIDTISIKLDRTDGKGSSLEFTGEFVESKDKRGSGTWTAEIPAKSKPVTDGTYQAVVTIKDATGRTTTQSTTFTIDNTPPLLILQRPATDISTTDESSIDTYGKILTLEGRAADDNNIDHIDVKIYSDPGKTNLIHTITLKNVPLSIALDAAKWGDEAYNKIYGNTVGEKARYYCSIEAYDAAQRYPADGSAQKDADKNGNCANYYYLYNEIANSAIADYKVTELYSVLNGTSSRAATDTKTVTDLLTKLKKGTGTFFLNPRNNPTFKLSGWTQKTFDEQGNELEPGFVTFDGTSMNLDVEPGLDGYPVLRDSLKVYLIKVDNYVNGKAQTGVNPKRYLAGDDVKITGASTYKVAVTTNRTATLYDENGNEVSDKLSYGDYLIGVDGRDKENSLEPEIYSMYTLGYPITISKSGGAPDLEVSYELNGEEVSSGVIYMPKYKPGTANEASEIKVSGTVKVSSNDAGEKPTVKLDVDGTVQDVVITHEDSYEEGEYRFNNLIVNFSSATKSGDHTITVIADNGAKSQDKRNVYYDMDFPEITISSVSPIASTYKEITDDDGKKKIEVDDTDFINGNISIAISITDNDSVDITTNKPKIELIQKNDNNQEVVKYTVSNITKLPFDTGTIDTEDLDSNHTKLDDNKPVIIRVTGYDRSGNKWHAEKTYKVKQSTDMPVVMPSNSDQLSFTYTAAELNPSTSGSTSDLKNRFSIGAQLPVELREDDDLQSSTIWYFKTTDQDAEKPTAEGSGVKKITKTLSGNKNSAYYDLPEEAGCYKVWLDVTDTENNTTNVTPFFIKVASGSPVVTLKSNEYVTTAADANLIKTTYKAPLNVSITIKSTEGPFTVYRAKVTSTNTDPAITDAQPVIFTSTNDSGEETSFTSVELPDGQSSVTVVDKYAIPETDDDGEYKLKYFVLDNSGINPGTSVLTYTLDKNPPKFGDIQLDNDTIGSDYYSKSSMSLSVTPNDGSGSGVSSVEYSLDNGANWTPLNLDNSTGKYSRNVSFVNGENTLKVRFVDNVENFKIKTKTVNVDIESPEFKVTKKSTGSLENAISVTAGDYIYINDSQKDKSLVLYGEYKDTKSGVENLKVKIGTVEATVKYYSGTEVESALSDADYVDYSSTNKTTIKYWRAEFTKDKLSTLFATSTTKQITFEDVKDTCGNVTNTQSNTITVMKDVELPTFENIILNSSTQQGLYKESDTKYFIKADSGVSYTLTGIAKETVSGVKLVTCIIDDDEENALTSTSAGWSFTIPFDGAADGASKVIKLKVEDKAGNLSAANPLYTITIYVDKSAPKAEHIIDAKQKDLMFRVGDYKNGNELDVGGKYSQGTYGNASTLLIRGLFEDSKFASGLDGSGIKKYYYYIFNGADITEEITIDHDKPYTSATETVPYPYITENGTVYFKDVDTLKNYVIANKTGDFATITKESRTVSKNNADGTSTSETIWSNYKPTIKGLKEGKNFLVIVAEDNVGNTAIDYAENVPAPTDDNPNATKTYYCYSLNVDNTLPAFEEKTKDDFKKIYLTNGTTNLSETIEFWVQDDDSGLDDEKRQDLTKIPDILTLKIGDQVVTPSNDAGKSLITIGDKEEYTVSGNKHYHYLVTVNIGKDDLTAVDGYQSIIATVTDSAGNSSAPKSLGIINKDVEAPIPSFISPVANAEVNKTITVEGKITETNGINSITLKATGTSGSVTYTYPDFTNQSASAFNNTTSYAEEAYVVYEGALYKCNTAHTGNWNEDNFTKMFSYDSASKIVTAIIDTTILDPSFKTSGTSATLTLTATDEAGNVTETADIANLSIKINQHADRPIITIGSNVDFSKDNNGEIWVKGSSTIYGSVIDDDGIASASDFKIWRKTANTDWVNAGATYNGGSWNVRLPSDGSYVLKFEINDKEGTTFTSAELTSSCTDPEILATPVIQDASEEGGAHQLGLAKNKYPSTLVPICLDTASPTLVINAIKAKKIGEETPVWIEDYNRSDFYLGGDLDTFYLKVSASDTSGLADDDEVTATFSGTMKVGNDEYGLICSENSCTVEDGESEGEYIITVKNFKESGKISKTTNAEGNEEVNISTTDKKDFSGTLQLTITATDKAGLTTDKQLSRTIDNKKPSIRLSVPASVTSTAVVSGSIEGETVNPEVWFMLTKDSTQPVANSPYWKQDTFASLSYNIYFDGIESSTATHTDLFRTYLLNAPLNLVTQTEIDNKTATLKDVYVWIKVKDVCGNTSYEHALVKVDPLGNIPSVTITYPAKDEVKLGGTITLMGMATDNVEAKYVWIKLDTDGDGDWDLEDYNKLIAATNSGYTFGYIKQNKTLADAALTPSASNIGDIAIMVPISGGSWNQNTNADNELIPSGTTSNSVKMWVTATDDDAGNGTDINQSVEVTRTFIADNDNPYFVQSSLKVTKLGGYEQVYKEGMSVKGEWWLEGTVVDDGSGIKKISVKDLTSGSASDVIYIDISNTEKVEITEGDFQFRQVEAKDKNNNTIYNYNLKIKVGAGTGVGEKSFRITAYENTTNNLSTYKDFKVTYDNVKPTILAHDKEDFKISSTVTNSQGYYSLRSVAYEKETGDTGVERVAVFFTRTVDTTTYVFDPMYKRTVAASKLETGSTSLVQDSGEGGDMLYWGSATASSISSKKLTISGTIPSYVHVGGLAKVNGVVYRIDGVTSSTVTLSDAPGDKTSNTTVYFAVANVVDNENPEAKDSEKDTNNSAYNSTTGFGYGYCDKYVYDDGDKIMENLHKDDSTSWTWELYVNSKNISDGDVDIHYVVFDKAGNSEHDVVTGASVQNNKPRLVGVQIGLDKNQNGSIDSDETTEYFPDGLGDRPVQYKNAVETINISEAMTVKGKMTVTPEVVGGNGNMFYRWKTTKTGSWKEETAKFMDGNNNYDDADFSDTNDYVGENGLIINRNGNTTATITHDTQWFIDNSTANGSGFAINYEIWDTTDGKTKFSNSNNVSINITNIDLQVRDTESPTVTIDDFYWNSLTDNSVYTSKASAQIKSISDLEGHIELEDDWMETPTYTSNAEKSPSEQNAEFDGDPKVSGKIKLKGTVSDNIVIKDLYLLIDGMTGISSSTKVATYDKTNGKWQNADGTADFAKVGTLASNGYEFNILTDSNKFDSTGHSVDWTLVWDTEKIGNVTRNNVKVQLTAHDNASTAGHTVNNAAADFEATSIRQMDVVPYITEVIRGTDSTGKAFNTNRARSGAVSLRRGDVTNIIRGYNLGKATNTSISIVPDKEAAQNGVTAATWAMVNKDAQNNDITPYLTFTVPDTAKSGYLHVVVNNVAALNNMNAYQSYNVETNAKAFDHNDLADDRYVHIWRVSTADTFKGSLNANYPAMSSDSNGVLYASFTNYGQAKSYYSKAFVDASSVAYETSATATGDVTTVYYGYDPSEDTDISVGADGKVNVFYNGNFHGGQSYSWDGNSPSYAGGIFVYDPDAPSINYNTNSGNRHNLYRFELYTYDNELNQFKNTRVSRTYVNNEAYVNIAYYDRLANAIKYSFATDSINAEVYDDTNVTFTYNGTYYTSSEGNSYYSNYNNYYIKSGENYYKLTRYTNNRYDRYTIENFTENTVTSKIYNLTKEYDTSTNGAPWITIDGQGDNLDITGTKEDTNETFTFAGGWSPFKLDTSRYSGVSQTDGTGESVAITSTSSGYPVILYMDASKGQPRIAFANSRTPTTAANWTVQGVFASTDDNYDTVSDYLSCMVNGNDLHIAFQNTKGQLVYGVGTYNNETKVYDFGESQVIDDSGMWIDMTMNNGVPYISYLSRVNSYDGMKIAFYDANFDEDNDGTADGGWETVTAAMNAKVTNVRTCIEPNARAADYATTNKKYTVAIGYHPGSDYRAAFYVGQ